MTDWNPSSSKTSPTDVIFAFLKLSRAMRRCPPERKEFPFPPAIGRLLGCLAANPGVSSRELCEALDLRPSSLSEMLSRAETEGLISRETDESDRRIQRVSLSPRGKEIIREMETARALDAQKKTACLSQEEQAQFCALCNRLSEHLEQLALELPESMRQEPPRPGRPGGPHCRGPHRWDEEPPRRGPDDLIDPEGRPPLPPKGRYRC